MLGAVVPACQPLGSGIAASWALGLAWLAGVATAGLAGPTLSSQESPLFYCSQDQTKSRPVQVSGILGDLHWASPFS